MYRKSGMETVTDFRIGISKKSLKLKNMLIKIKWYKCDWRIHFAIIMPRFL